MKAIQILEICLILNGGFSLVGLILLANMFIIDMFKQTGNIYLFILGLWLTLTTAGTFLALLNQFQPTK